MKMIKPEFHIIDLEYELNYPTGHFIEESVDFIKKSNKKNNWFI